MSAQFSASSVEDGLNVRKLATADGECVVYWDGRALMQQTSASKSMCCKATDCTPGALVAADAQCVHDFECPGIRA